MAASIRIAGADAITRAFEQLPPRLARKVIRRALRAGAKVIQADAKALAPVDTGLTKKAIKVRAGKSRKKNVIAMAVIIGRGDYKGVTFYGAFQELGRKTGRRGSERRRQVPGKHFMQKALAEKADQARSVATELILEGVEREVISIGRAGPAAAAAAGASASPATSTGPGRDAKGRFISATS